MSRQKPEYLNLYEIIRDEITSGSWPYGARLPSRRQTALDRGLSAVTVEHSYELLCQEGYIQARSRSGYYVIYRSDDGFAAVDSQPLMHAPVDEADAEDAFPFSVLASAMRRVLADYGEALLCKPPNEGCLELRTAISRYLARNRGIQASEEQIIIRQSVPSVAGDHPLPKQCSFDNGHFAYALPDGQVLRGNSQYTILYRAATDNDTDLKFNNSMAPFMSQEETVITHGPILNGYRVDTEITNKHGKYSVIDSYEAD